MKTSFQTDPLISFLQSIGSGALKRLIRLFDALKRHSNSELNPQENVLPAVIETLWLIKESRVSNTRPAAVTSLVPSAALQCEPLLALIKVSPHQRLKSRRPLRVCVDSEPFTAIYTFQFHCSLLLKWCGVNLYRDWSEVKEVFRYFTVVQVALLI